MDSGRSGGGVCGNGRPDCGGCCGTVRTGEFLPGGLAAGETGKRAVSRGICLHEEAELSAATWEEKRVLPPGRAARAASNFAPCGQRVGALHSKRICLRGINHYRSCFVVGNSRPLSARSVCGAAVDRGGAGRGYVTVSRGAEASCRPCRTMPGNTREVPSGKGRVAAKPNRRHRKTMSGGRTSPNRYCRAGPNPNSRHGSTVSGVLRKSLMGAVGRGGFGVGTRSDAFGAWSALAYVCRKIRFPAVGRRAGSLRHRCGSVALIACGSGGSLRREAAIRQSGRVVILTVRSAAFAVWRQPPSGNCDAKRRSSRYVDRPKRCFCRVAAASAGKLRCDKAVEPLCRPSEALLLPCDGSLRREAAIRQSGRAVMPTVRSAAFAVWRQHLAAPPRG